MTYQNVLERLKEERLRQHWSQIQMGGQMRMSQSHYSKVELGNRRLTFYQIQYLCDTEIDVHYICELCCLLELLKKNQRNDILQTTLEYMKKLCRKRK